MKKDSIEYLAYLLDKAKKEGKDKAIVFLGAGTSVSAGIPLTNVIVRHIKLKFKINPLIKDNKSTDYYELMGCLTPDERRDLFHFYVTRKKVKLNIANVYLAQLLKLGYVDYIVTVNFDDLILKASTLYNFLPPVYDISNIKTITTTDIRTNSVIYLHGQYFGQWLLNNKEELAKVEAEILGLFNTIKTRRTWIVVGYSGNDGIFDKIKSLGSFSNELFWVKKQFNNPKDKHVIDFINAPNVNAHKIEGYYADSFFLKLHAELSILDDKLKAPDIFYKPFTYLKSIMNDVCSVDESDELNKPTANLIKVCNSRISKAIQDYEIEKTLEHLQQEIIDAILKKDFSDEKVKTFEEEIKTQKYENAKEQLTLYYGEWGVALYDLAKKNGDENLYKECFEKYKTASELNPKNDKIFNNWGIALKFLAKQILDENLFKESLNKYKTASELNPKNELIFNNWGNALYELAKQNRDENLYKESFEKYKTASELNPKDDGIYNNWGIALFELAKHKGDENLYKESFEKYKTASELNPKNDSIFNNWGVALYELTKQNGDENLYKESFEKYKTASELNPKNDSIFYNWGSTLMHLAKLKNNDKDLFAEAEIVLQKGVALRGGVYNLGCLFALQNNKEKAFFYLEKSLQNKEISIIEIEKDEDWNNLRDEMEYKELLKKYSNI